MSVMSIFSFDPTGQYLSHSTVPNVFIYVVASNHSLDCKVSIHPLTSHATAHVSGRGTKIKIMKIKIAKIKIAKIKIMKISAKTKENAKIWTDPHYGSWQFIDGLARTHARHFPDATIISHRLGRTVLSYTTPLKVTGAYESKHARSSFDLDSNFAFLD